MAVRFIIGRAGTGKTQHCFAQIVAAMVDAPLGPPIYWLLPRQATFDAERALVCRSGLGAFTRCRVVSVEELSRCVLDECGGIAMPEISPAGRRMIIGHLLRQHEQDLRFFRGVARQPGLADEIDATFSELERSGKTPAEIVQALSPTDDSPDIADLRPKIHDIRVLYDAYSKLLTQDRLDPHRRVEKVVECLRDWRSLRRASVYVDGFYDFTQAERKLIVGLAQTASCVEIATLADPRSVVIETPDVLPDDLSLFHRTECAFRRLYIELRDAGVEMEPPLLLRETRRFANGSLAEIERRAMAGFASAAKGTAPHVARASSPCSSSSRQDSSPRAGSPCHGENPAEARRTSELPDEPLFVEAHDRAAEVDAAARHILDLLRAGHRLRDITVLVRDLNAYQSLVDASFTEHGIPYFVDRRRAAVHHPLLQFVAAVMRIARHDWPHDAVMALLRTGLAGVSLDDADGIENYVLEHRIRGGSAWTTAGAWTFHRKTTHRDEDADEAPTTKGTNAATIDVLRRRIAEKLAPFAIAVQTNDARPLRQFVVDLYALLERFDVTKGVQDLMARASKRNEHEQHDEHQQVWNELVALLEQMVDLLGDEPVTFGDFTSILEAGLEQFDLALTPPTLDGVIIGQVDRSRTPPVRAALVLGLNAGEFPKVPREDSVLTDVDRRALREGGRIELESDSERRLYDESLLAYVALTRASERLYVSRTLADDAGKALEPSVVWENLRAMFPDALVESVRPQHPPPPEHAATPGQLVSALLQWTRQQTGATVEFEPAHWPSLYQKLAEHVCCDDVMDETRYRAWKSLAYENEATLSPALAARMFATPLLASVRQIETFAACPFRHFVEYGLGLRARPSSDVTMADLSAVYHDVLERLVRQMLRTRKDWTDATASWTKQQIAQCAQQVGEALRGELLLSSARNRYLLDRVQRTLEQVVESQRALASRAKIKTGYAGLKFQAGSGGLDALRLRTRKGNELHIHGRIDRVDVLADESAFAVFDYRLGVRQLPLGEAYHGLSVRLLTYLLVLQENGHQLTGKPMTPVAAFYLQLLRGLESVDHPDDAGDPTDPGFHLRLKPRGIFDSQHLTTFDTQIQPGKDSEVVAAYVKQDGSFGNRHRTDVATPEEFAALLRHVRSKLEHLADAIIGGHVGLRPYRLGTTSACGSCDMRSVCRFDPSINRYNIIPGMSREQVLLAVREEGGGGDA